ncbi:MAG: hypothetical protein IT355_07135 [Gemmatimonadaceae bacterium]|nr:hypothetical protein [Gemmatimonadaceae bacterium]
MTFRTRAPFLLLLAAVAPHTPALAQPAAYSVTPPAGWLSAAQDGATLFVPPGGPPGNTYILLLPVQPRTADFPAQFTANRQRMEAALGLTLTLERPGKRGSGAAGDFAAWFGTYRSSQGMRHVAYMARADSGAYGSMLFLVDSDSGYQRHAGKATEMFNGLRLTPEAARLAAAAPPLTPAAPREPAGTPPTRPGPVHVTAGRVPADALSGRALDLRRELGVSHLEGTWVFDTIKRDFRVSFGSQTMASGSTYETMTTSMTTMEGGGGTYLRVEPDGHYRFFHGYRDRNCSTTLTHEGTLTLEGRLLVMQPQRAHESSHRLTAGAPRSCVERDGDGSLAPRRYTVDLTVSQTVYGLPTYHLSLTNADARGESIKSFERLQARPLPESAGMLPNSTPPTQLPPPRMVGTWLVASDDAPLDAAGFLSPATRYDDRRYRAGLRILANGRYELVVRRPDVLSAPVCTRDLLLVEQGEVRVATSPYNANGGNLILQPTSSRLDDRILQCGAESVQRTADLSLAPRHLHWQMSGSRGEQLAVLCGDWADRQAAWRFLSCPQDAAQVYRGYTRQ